MDVDEALLRWFTQVRSQSLAVDGPLLMEKAKALSIELGVPDFVGRIDMEFVCELYVAKPLMSILKRLITDD